MKSAALVASAVVLVGVIGALGYVTGTRSLDRAWAAPITRYQGAAPDPSSDPSPQAGASVLGPLPLGRARQALADFAVRDPLVVTVGSVGRDDASMYLHLTIANHAACEVVEYAGVAYGFDARGQSAKLNRDGAHFVAFRGNAAEKPANGDDLYPRLEPGSIGRHSSRLRHPEVASVVLAHVDAFRCSDGTSWSRTKP